MMSKANKSGFPMPKVDFAFHWLFVHSKNKKILKGFLEAVLGLSIASFEHLIHNDTRLLRRHENDKMGILDVLVTLVDGTKIHIEMQLHFHNFLLERVTFYNARILSDQLEKGKPYMELNKVVSVLISAEEAIKNSPYYHHTFHYYDKEHDVLLTDLVEIHVLELSKLPEQPDESKEYNWLKFFKSDTREELEMVAITDESIKEAYDELERLNQDEMSMLEYTKRKLAIWDEQARLDTAIERGIEQGRYEEKLNTAKKLKELNTPIEIIAQATGLSESEIESL